MTPTIEQIENKMHEYGLDSNRCAQDLCDMIHHRKFKPLSELSQDEEACRFICEFAFEFPEKTSKVNGIVTFYGTNKLGVYGNKGSVTIYDNKIVFQGSGLKKEAGNVFKWVDLLRSLGYSA